MKKTKKMFKYIFVFSVITFIFSNNVYASCPLGPDVTKDLYGALKFVRILAPVLVIVLSTIDAVKALTKGDGGADFKKVAQRFGKRCIFAVLLFFLPMLIDQFMQMADVWEVGGTCDIESAGGSGNNNPSTTQKTTTKKDNSDAARVVCESLGKTWDYVNKRCIESYTTTTTTTKKTTTTKTTTTKTTTTKNGSGETLVDPVVYERNPKNCYTEIPTDFSTNVDGNSNYTFGTICVNSSGAKIDCNKAKAPYKFRLLATYGSNKNKIIKEWTISEKC